MERSDYPHTISRRKAEKHETRRYAQETAATPAEWERLIAAAPGKDRALTPSEAQNMAHAVVAKGGGYAAVREALAKKRERGAGW